ncbi:MAG TPA: hydroxylamine reductase, partial [Spirochaetota bacterium]|nr:hydroxylamine reductase [Spirochaetota bacterium]
MSMFCFQCQETVKNQGCLVKGVCGKEESTAQLQDLLIYNLKGIAYLAESKIQKGEDINAIGKLICDSLFATITNANFDNARITELIKGAVAMKKQLAEEAGMKDAPEAASWINTDSTVFIEKGKTVGVLSTENEDVRSLRELLIYGLKGIAAYMDHAVVLGYSDSDIYKFMIEGLAS